MSNQLKDYPMDCESCDTRMKLIGSWVSGGSGLTISLWQCPECKEVQNMLSDKPLLLQGLCPRCGSENIKEQPEDFSLCTDCLLVFKELKNSLHSKHTEPEK